jgi:hypothetical protein
MNLGTETWFMTRQLPKQAKPLVAQVSSPVPAQAKACGYISFLYRAGQRKMPAGNSCLNPPSWKGDLGLPIF